MNTILAIIIVFNKESFFNGILFQLEIYISEIKPPITIKPEDKNTYFRNNIYISDMLLLN